MLLPTRSHNLLDLVLTTSTDFVPFAYPVDNLPDTDHDAVSFTIMTSAPTRPTTKRVLYNYKKADFKFFRSTLSRIPWDLAYPSDGDDDIDQLWNVWKDLFFSAIDFCIPKSSWCSRKSKYWFTKDTLYLIRKKRRIYLKLKRSPTPYLTNYYKKLSNLVRTATRQDTGEYVESISNSSFTHPKRFWRWINSSKGYRSPIPPLYVKGSTVSDDSDKAEILNNHFCSVFTDEDVSNLSNLKSSLSYHPTIIDAISVSPADVLHELKSLRADKACGPDSIPAYLLKQGAEELCVSLSRLFQHSVASGSLPKDWTVANVVPVHKRGDRSDPNNYRPISLTSVLVKMLERIICRHLVLSLECSDCFSVHQHGFRRKRSTVTLLLEAVND